MPFLWTEQERDGNKNGRATEARIRGGTKVTVVGGRRFP